MYSRSRVTAGATLSTLLREYQNTLAGVSAYNNDAIHPANQYDMSDNIIIPFTFAMHCLEVVHERTDLHSIIRIFNCLMYIYHH